VKDCKIDMS